MPVFLSSLLQLPLVRLMHGPKVDRRRAHGQPSGPDRGPFRQLRHSHGRRPRIRGMEGKPEFWETIIEGKRHDFDMDRLEAEESSVPPPTSPARKPSTPSSSNARTFSAFSRPIQQATGLPVYDINSLVEYAHYAVCRKAY